MQVITLFFQVTPQTHPETAGTEEQAMPRRTIIAELTGNGSSDSQVQMTRMVGW